MATSTISGSGLDIPSLVSSLVTAARTPTENRINLAGTASTAKLSAISQVKSIMTSLQSALSSLVSGADTAAYKPTVQSEAGFTATTSSKAAVGTYSVKVESLATAQKQATTNAYSKDDTFGSGSLTFAYGEDGTEIQVEIGEGATLADVATAVNKAAGGKGVVASVVTDDDGQHLVLGAVGLGTANALTVSATGADLQALAGALNTTVEAKDAVVTVDGFKRTLASNTVEDLVPGVTLNLTKANVDTSYTLTVASDNSALKTNLSGFASAYNAAMTLLKSSSAYNADTQTASALTGDSLVRGLQQQLRGMVSANLTDLKALGITLDKDGVMSFDGTSFDKAIAADPEAATKIFGKDGSYGAAMTKLLDNNLNATSGTLVLRTNTLNKQINDLEEQLDDLDDRMTRLSDLYTKQFTAMETMIVQMQGSASSLDSLLSMSSE